MSCVRSQAYLGVQLSQKFNNKNIEGIEHVKQNVAKWVAFRFDIASLIQRYNSFFSPVPLFKLSTIIHRLLKYICNSQFK